MPLENEILWCIPDIGLSNLISIFSILINAGLAIWVVQVIQKKMTDKRVLKDHFINEIIKLRKLYTDQTNKLYKGECNAKSIMPWFKVMNTRVNSVVEILHSEFEIEKKVFSAYQIELRLIIDEFEEYMNAYKDDQLITLMPDSKRKIMDFHGKNEGIFNQLIVNVNNAN